MQAFKVLFRHSGIFEVFYQTLMQTNPASQRHHEEEELKRLRDCRQGYILSEPLHRCRVGLRQLPWNDHFDMLNSFAKPNELGPPTQTTVESTS